MLRNPADAISEQDLGAVPEPERELTHWVDTEAVRYANGARRAVCGELVRYIDHDSDPTCPKCQAILEEDMAALDKLRTEVWPDPPPVRKPFDPCAGYTPKRGVR